MANRLLDLESQLPQTSDQGSAAPSSSSRPARPATAGPESPRIYQLPDKVPGVGSERPNGSWAAAIAMMMSWRERQTIGIEETLSNLGSRWLDLYQQEAGLTEQQGVELLAAAGLSSKPPQALLPDLVFNSLTEYGPIWLTAISASTPDWSSRGWIVTGITGDGTPEGAILHAINTESGESVRRMLRSITESPKGNAQRFKIIHWAAPIRLDRSSSPEGEGNVVPLNLKPAAPTGTPSEQPRPDLESVISDLVAQGADEADLRAFLAEAGAPGIGHVASQKSASLAVPVSDMRKTATIPRASLLEGFRATAFRAALFSVLPGGAPVARIFSALPMLATRYNVTIGVGPSVSGGFVAGAGLGGGVVFAPGNRIGYYGSISGILGAIVSISATLQATVVHGGPEKFGGESVLASVTVDTAVGPSIGAHAIFSISGEYLGVTAEVGASLGLSPFEAFAQYQYTGSSLAYQSGAITRDFDIKLRIFIPAPAVDGPGTNPFGGDGRSFDYSSGTHRGVIHARLSASPSLGHTPSLSVIDRSWGESTEYNQSDVVAAPGKPFWFKNFVGSPTPIRRSTLPATPSNLSISARNVSLRGGAHAVKVRLHAHGALPLMPVSPAIDVTLDIYFSHAGSWQYMIRGDHDGFPAYELYIDRRRVYAHDPISRDQTPASLLPPAEFEVSTPWRRV